MRHSTLLTGVAHGFTGRGEGDLRAGLVESAANVVASLRGTSALHVVTQVHGARVVDATTADLSVEADGIVSTLPGVVIAVRVADCVPILMAAPGGVAAIHAGWRGTAADIARAGFRALLDATSCAPEQVRVAIGPCIGPCCYEVGGEVIDGVGRVAPGRRWLAGRNVDLALANAEILRGEGATVDVLRVCTRCDDAYWSHRRDGEGAGRQVGAIRA